MKEEKIGFTIGKFASFHKGHEYLINKALEEMDKVIVIIYETDVIDIPIHTRAKWIKELFPSIEIRIALNPPRKYGLDKESVKIQMEYLTKILGNTKITHFYSSEPYGKCVAEYLNIINRQIDSERKIIPISATKIRNNLEQNKNYLNKDVYETLKINKKIQR